MPYSQHWGSEESLFPEYLDAESSSLIFEDKLVESEARSLGTNGILPKWAVSSSFTSCVMAALGALTVHSFFEIVLTMEVKVKPWVWWSG